MKNLSVREIMQVTKAELIQGDPDLICKSFSKDTRTIEKGDTYIAIKGDKFDGNLFWKQALEKGADCVIVSEISYGEKGGMAFPDKTILKVKDTLEALYEIAKLKRSFYQIPVIAITGSVGKTSTKDIIASVVSQKYKTLKTIGNNNNNIGLPFTILKLQDEEAIVLEMGMNHFGEIRLLSQIAKPNICIITNIGTSHIGNLGSRENILKAKLEILEGAENPTIIINQDNDLLHKWKEENNQYNIITYGIHEPSDLMAQQVMLQENGSEFTCEVHKENVKIKVPVGGEYFISNSLCAICVGELLDIENNKIKKGIEEFELTKRRMEITELDNGAKIINDAYNASLESMQVSLQYVSKLKASRKIAVLGDMLELGEYTKELHEKVGEEVYKNQMDLLMCQGKNAKYIAKKAKESGMPEKNIYYFETKDEMENKLKEMIRSGDVVLLKASNGMRFFDLVERLKI